MTCIIWTHCVFSFGKEIGKCGVDHIILSNFSSSFRLCTKTSKQHIWDFHELLKWKKLAVSGCEQWTHLWKLCRTNCLRILHSPNSDKPNHSHDNFYTWTSMGPPAFIWTDRVNVWDMKYVELVGNFKKHLKYTFIWHILEKSF